MSGAIIVLSVAFFIVFPLVFSMAHTKRKTYETAKNRSYSLSENFTQLREFVENEAERWPIYARPVIFTNIDHDAQIEFAKAHRSIKDAEEVIPEIDTITIPASTKTIDLGSFFNLDKNLRIIQAGNRMSGVESFLNESIHNLEDSVKTIREDWYRVEKIRRTIRKSIYALKDRLDKTNERLNPIDKLGMYVVGQVSWALQVADNCYLSSYERVRDQPEDELGYFEHVVANVFVEIGNFALDCVDLYAESELVSKNYELDVFTSLFKKSTDFLVSILEIDDLSGWRKLSQTKRYIDQFPDTKNIAIASLMEFKRQRNLFESRKDYLGSLNLQNMIRNANSLQEECAFYWYTYEERRDEWEKIIKNHPLPTISLTRIESEFVSNILPFTGHDVIVKQSALPVLITVADRVLVWLRQTHQDITNLSLELSRHKHSQNVVEKMLSNDGKTYLTIIRLNSVLQDTAPEVVDQGRKLIPLYQSFVSRAETVRGANYPALEQELKTFTNECDDLIDDHITRLANLKSTYENLKNTIKKSLDDFDIYIHFTPAFDDKSTKAFSLFYDSGWNILQTTIVGTYSELITKIGDMKKWSQMSDSYLIRAHQKLNAFVDLRNQVHKQTGIAQGQIEAQRNIASRKWGWAKREIIQATDHAEGNLGVEMNNWQRHVTRNWAELYIHQAIKHCESFLGFIDTLLNELNISIKKINYEQEKINNRVKDIKSIIFSNKSKLSLDEIEQVKTLMAIAARAEDKEVAESILRYSEKIALRQASRQERADAEKIIIINSGGGAVVMGNVSTRGGFTGRDNNSVRILRNGY